MKKFRRIGNIMMVALLLLSITGCNKDDYAEQLIGNWSYTDYAKNEIRVFMFNADMTYASMGVAGTNSYAYNGTYTCNKDKVTTTSSDGTQEKFEVDFADGKLIITQNGTDRTYERFRSDLALEGKWKVEYSTVYMSSKKNELVIPASIVEGTDFPQSIPVESFSGSFFEYATEKYFRNICFTDSELLYDVAIDDENVASVSKKYAVNGTNMHISGTVMNYPVDMYLLAVQDINAEYTTMVINKEYFASMIISYINMLSGAGLGSVSSPEVLEEFKQSIIDTYDALTGVVVIKRVQ